MDKQKHKLVVLYQQMYEHTKDECSSCRNPRSCCSPEYCEQTIEYAKERWNVDLQRTNHSRLPLMGENGCIAAPHLRPDCTLHTCDINGFALKPDDPQWTDRYFDLRDEINQIEMEVSLK